MKATRISIKESVSKTTFFANRTRETTAEDFKNAYTILSDYRDGAIFLANYAGNSDWERHVNGDEVVHVLDGQTTIYLITGGEEQSNFLKSGELIVVPKGTWHRFETALGAKVMTITPQPTDHSKERPQNA